MFRNNLMSFAASLMLSLMVSKGPDASVELI